MGEEGISSASLGSPLRRKLASLDTFSSCAPKGPPQIAKTMTTMFTSCYLDKDVADLIPGTYVVAFLDFDQPCKLDETKRLIKERLFEIPRFRSFPSQESPGSSEYIFQLMESSDWLVDQLVTELSDVKSTADLDSFASNVHAMTWNTSLPLWRAYVINHMENGRNTICFVLSHAIADGTSLIAALLSVLDDGDAAPEVPSSAKSSTRVGCFSATIGLFRALYNIVVGDQLPGDRASKLKLKNHRRPGCAKSLSMSQGISISKMKEVKATHPGATLNDVIMTTVTLTAREYFAAHEPIVLKKKRKLRANFPINLRKKGDDPLLPEHFGNRFVPGTLSLPIHTEDPTQTLVAVKRQIDMIKSSPEPYLRDKALTLLARSLPRKRLADMVLDVYGKVTMMMSNVAGPIDLVYFGGQPVANISQYTLAPIGVYIGVTSYNGRVNCGIVTDQEQEPRAANLSDLWASSFDKLHEAAMMKKRSVGRRV